MQTTINYTKHRGMSRPYMYSKATAGVAANQIIRDLKDLGLSYRRKDMLRDIRDMKRETVKADKIKYVPRKYRPTEAALGKWTGFMRRNYLFEGKIKVENTETGEIIDEWGRLSSDTLLTKREMEDFFADMWSQDAYHETVLEVSITKGWKQM